MMSPNAPYRFNTAEMATIYPRTATCVITARKVCPIIIADWGCWHSGRRTGVKLLNICSAGGEPSSGGVLVCAGLAVCFYHRCWRGMFGMRTVSAGGAQLRQVLGGDHRLEIRLELSDMWQRSIMIVGWLIFSLWSDLIQVFSLLFII